MAGASWADGSSPSQFADLEYVSRQLQWNPYPRDRESTQFTFWDTISDSHREALKFRQDNLLQWSKDQAKEAAYFLCRYPEGRAILDVECAGPHATDPQYWRSRAKVYQIEHDRLSQEEDDRPSRPRTAEVCHPKRYTNDLDRAKCMATNWAVSIKVLPGGQQLLDAQPNEEEEIKTIGYWQEKEKIWKAQFLELAEKTSLQRAKAAARREARVLATFIEGEEILKTDEIHEPSASSPRYWYDKQRNYMDHHFRLRDEFWEGWKSRILHGKIRRQGSMLSKIPIFHQSTASMTADLSQSEPVNQEGGLAMDQQPKPLSDSTLSSPSDHLDHEVDGAVESNGQPMKYEQDTVLTASTTPSKRKSDSSQESFERPSKLQRHGQSDSSLSCQYVDAQTSGSLPNNHHEPASTSYSKQERKHRKTRRKIAEQRKTEPVSKPAAFTYGKIYQKGSLFQPQESYPSPPTDSSTELGKTANCHQAEPREPKIHDQACSSPSPSELSEIRPLPPSPTTSDSSSRLTCNPSISTCAKQSRSLKLNFRKRLRDLSPHDAKPISSGQIKLNHTSQSPCDSVLEPSRSAKVSSYKHSKSESTRQRRKHKGAVRKYGQLVSHIFNATQANPALSERSEPQDEAGGVMDESSPLDPSQEKIALANQISSSISIGKLPRCSI